MSVEVYEINDFEQFKEIEFEWNELLADTNYNVPFLRHEWFVNWWNHFGAGHQLVIIAARQAGKLVFAMPLMEKHLFLFGSRFVVLQSQTNSHSFRYAFLLKQGATGILEKVWDYLRKRPRPWHLLIMQEMPVDAVSHDSLLQAADQHSHHIGLWSKGMSPYLALDGDWNSYLASLNKKFRSNLKRRRKKLAEVGAVSFDCQTFGDQVDNVLRQGLALEQKGWKGENGSAIACSPKLVSFYSNLARISAEKGWLRLSTLNIDQAPIAFDFGLEYNSQRFCMKIAYDPEHHKSSPGQLLAADILTYCFEHNLREVDFLGTATKQKLDWTRRSREVIWVFIYNKKALSSLHYLYKFQLKARVKEFLEKEKGDDIKSFERAERALTRT